MNIDNCNTRVVEAEYAVRGTVPLRAMKIEEEIKEGAKYPFDKLIYCNIGNPIQVGQKPLTYIRQVVAACQYPDLMGKGVLPSDVEARATEFIRQNPGGMGAYTHSQGYPSVRKHICEYIAKRDHLDEEPNPTEIFLTDGAGQGVKNVLSLAVANVDKDGIMIPIPQYPLYSATSTMLGAISVPYYCDESKDWTISYEELNRAYDEAVSNGVTPRALCIISPGNPTASCLERSVIADALRFAHERNVIVLADEVYQDNIYTDDFEYSTIHRVLREMEKSNELPAGVVQVYSFHSVSKGYMAECGQRGGYYHTANVPQEIHAQLYKLASVNLCSNTTGQLIMDCITHPPVEGEESYELFMKEKTEILESLSRRSKMLRSFFETLKDIGLSVSGVDGALYAFPQIEPPKKALEEAKKRGIPLDTMWCLDLLENTGVVVVPGSGFGQVDGTWHFRTTILPQEDVFGVFLEKLRDFHVGWLKKYE